MRYIIYFLRNKFLINICYLFLDKLVQTHITNNAMQFEYLFTLLYGILYFPNVGYMNIKWVILLYANMSWLDSYSF